MDQTLKLFIYFSWIIFGFLLISTLMDLFLMNKYNKNFNKLEDEEKTKLIRSYEKTIKRMILCIIVGSPPFIAIIIIAFEKHRSESIHVLILFSIIIWSELILNAKRKKFIKNLKNSVVEL